MFAFSRRQELNTIEGLLAQSGDHNARVVELDSFGR